MPVYVSEDFDGGSSGDQVTNETLDIMTVGYTADRYISGILTFTGTSSISNPNSLKFDTSPIHEWNSQFEQEDDDWVDGVNTSAGVNFPEFSPENDDYIVTVMHLSIYFSPLENNFGTNPMIEIHKGGGPFSTNRSYTAIRFDNEACYLTETYIDSPFQATDTYIEFNYTPGAWYRFDLIMAPTSNFASWGFFTGSSLHSPNMDDAFAGSNTLPEVTIRDLWGYAGEPDELWEEVYDSDPDFYDNHPYVDYKFRRWPGVIRPSNGFTIQTARNAMNYGSIDIGTNIGFSFVTNTSNKISYLVDRFRVDHNPIEYPDQVDLSGWKVGVLPKKSSTSGLGGGGGGSW